MPTLTTPTPFGKTADGENASLYTLTNANGLSAVITDFGARLVRLNVPDANGRMADIVLGFDSVEEYQSPKDQSFGATVGRVAGRIAGAQFTLNGKTYHLDANWHGHTIHGGSIRPMKSILWAVTNAEHASACVDADPSARLELTCHSRDGEGGFPGNVSVRHTYTLTDENTLRLDYTATTDQPTPLMLTNHSYFNLAGHDGGPVGDHVLTINASRYTPWNEDWTPTGELASVVGEPVDFRRPTPIGKRLDQVTKQFTGGYDHYLILDKPDGCLAFAASAYHPGSGRLMEMFTTEPGLVFYSGNNLKSQAGKSGKIHAPQTAFCLEAEGYPGALQHPNFPSIILQPGQEYRQTTLYRFSVASAP